MESNKQNRTLSYVRKTDRAMFWCFMLLLLAPLVGMLLYVAGVSMFFSCLAVYFFQFKLLSYMTMKAPSTRVTINADDIEIYSNKEKKAILIYRVLCVVVSILDLYPLSAMSETMIGLFDHDFEVCLVYTLIIIMLLRIVYFIILEAPDTTDIFKVRRKFLVKGLTPDEIAEKNKIFAAQKREDKLREEKEKYGEGYTEIDQYLKLYINESLQKIFIQGNDYNFSDILSFSVQDNSRTIFSGTSSTAKTNNGNMLGRAVVGGLVAGNVGAVIGGATASKTIETSGGSSSVIHNYSIIVTVNSLSSPMVTLKIGKDQNLMNRISSILTVIVNRNKS
ncbi:MAG: hypothetical protein IJ692_02405 [Alloprevotella sp.]|nr:hypothetical protein [Alloprevotella sp.]